MVAHVFRDDVGIPLDDARGNANILGIRAVVEQQIFAQVFEPAPAEETLVAWGGIRRHHALSGLNALDLSAHGDNVAGQFVSEYGRRHDHTSVIAAAKDLYIRT